MDPNRTPFQPERDSSSVQTDFTLDESPKHISLLALPFVYLFQPSRYMKHKAVNLSTAALFLIIWVSGASSVLDSLQSKQFLGQSMLSYSKTWAFIFGVGFGGGILRGLMIYGIGGLWFRLRLRMCGVQSGEWQETGRVYMAAGIAKHLVTLGVIFYAAMTFDDFDDYMQNEGTVSVFVTLGLVILFQVWSSFTLYAGVRTVFDANRVWAAIWFLVLPILIRLVALAVIIGLSFMQGVAVDPQLDSPSQFSSDSFEFQYPSNWSVSKDDAIPGPYTWVQVEPFLADAIIEFNIEYIEPDHNSIEGYLEYIKDSYGIDGIEVESTLERMGKFQGQGTKYRGMIEGTEYTLNIFQTLLRDNVALLIYSIAESSIEEKIEPGFDHILRSMKATDPYTMTPNLDRTYTMMQDELSFDIPSNWWLTVTPEDDTTNEDGSTQPGGLTVEARTPGYGSFRVYIYDSDLGPRAELGVSINAYSDTGRLIDETAMDEWNGYVGFGAQGKYLSDSQMDWNVTILVVPLTDGRIIEFQSVYPDDYAPMFIPGYDLIEQTMKVNTNLIPSP